MINIGRIAGIYGYKGLVRVEPTGSFPQRFLQLQRVYLQRPEGNEMFEVEKAFLREKKIYLKFQGLDSKEQVSLYNLAFIQVPDDEVYSLPEGYYYHFQLQGLRVLDLNGRVLGELMEVLNPGAHDIYVVRKLDGRELLIPAVASMIKKIDLNAGEMLVVLPEGLED